jgi:hypothetical protein
LSGGGAADQSLPVLCGDHLAYLSEKVIAIAENHIGNYYPPVSRIFSKQAVL